MKECNVKVGDTVYIWHSEVKEMSKGIIEKIYKLGDRECDVRYDTGDFDLGLNYFNEVWFTIESLRQGYREITGLDNDHEFTDKELVEYMIGILERD